MSTDSTPDKSEMKAWRDLAVRAIDCLHDVERETDWGQSTFGPSVWETFRDEMNALSSRPADQVPDMVEALKTTTTHLIAAISLLRKIHGDLAPSKKHALFSTKLADYERASEKGRETLAALQAVPASGEVGEDAVRDPWNPDPEDPFWMLEIRQGIEDAGAWLKNEETYLTTRDPTKAIRWPSRFAAECARRRLPHEHNWRFEPTEHLWFNHAPEPPALKASGEE